MTTLRNIVDDLKLYINTVNILKTHRISVSKLDTLESDELKFTCEGDLNYETQRKLDELGWYRKHRSDNKIEYRHKIHDTLVTKYILVSKIIFFISILFIIYGLTLYFTIFRVIGIKKWKTYL
jgi:hypothetical protein